MNITCVGVIITALFLGLLWMFWWLTDCSVDTPEADE